MGCDFFYEGKLEDHRMQEKVVNFYMQWLTSSPDDHIIIHPTPEVSYLTQLDARIRPGTMFVWYTIKRYPFNYYGYIPKLAGLIERGQMVFDRNRGGTLVTLSKLPPYYPVEGDDTISSMHDDAEVCAKKGGYFRGIPNLSETFALALSIIKRRYFPGLAVSDDYYLFDEIYADIDNFRIGKIILNEELTFTDCSKIFLSALRKHRAKRKIKKNSHLSVIS